MASTPSMLAGSASHVSLEPCPDVAIKEEVSSSKVHRRRRRPSADRDSSKKHRKHRSGDRSRRRRRDEADVRSGTAETQALADNSNSLVSAPVMGPLASSPVAGPLASTSVVAGPALAWPPASPPARQRSPARSPSPAVVAEVPDEPTVPGPAVVTDATSVVASVAASSDSIVAVETPLPGYRVSEEDTPCW